MAQDVTLLLERWRAGDRAAFAELVPLVYDELRKIADAFLSRERPDHTLQPTALVHETYLRFVGTRSANFDDRTHFYGAAANAMRRVLVDHARRHGAAKRGDDWTRVFLDDIPSLGFADSNRLLDLDEALQRLALEMPRAAQVIELRCFGGMSVDEVASFLGLSSATVKRDWTLARAWLYRALVP